MPATRATPADAITELDALVGMSARRALAADRPLRPADVMVTPLVKRGEPVTLLFQSGSVRITLRGRALEDGGAGETIRVLNSDSERTVEAIVEGPGLARVLVPATSATVAAAPASSAGRTRTGGL
jgi:flagella basal body P-ring formation protein FlgA